MARKFLWRPDPPKAKDYDAKLKLGAPTTLPLEVSLRHLVSSILDQGNLGSCTTQAIFQAIRAALVRLGVPHPRLGSRLWGYYFGRAQSGNTQIDEGTWLRSVFDVVRKLGYPAEELWPYDDGPDTFKRMPGATAVRGAFDQRTSIGYYRISSTGQQRITDIKTALTKDYLVAFGTLVTSAFLSYAPGQPPLDVPKDGDTILGGHALVITGYETMPDGSTVFEILNSWGEGYGDHGYCKFTSAYLAWSESNDFWIVETMPDFSEKWTMAKRRRSILGSPTREHALNFKQTLARSDRAITGANRIRHCGDRIRKMTDVYREYSILQSEMEALGENAIRPNEEDCAEDLRVRAINALVETVRTCAVKR